MRRVRWAALGAGLLVASFALGQPPNPGPTPPQPSNDGAGAAPARVEVTSIAEDAQIAQRLTSILDATNWFVAPSVRVDHGIVFLHGTTQRDEHKEWAGRLANNTQDVVAVVNEIEVAHESLLDLAPALESLRSLSAGIVRRLPALAIAALLLLATWFAAKGSMRGASSLLHRRLKNPLLRDVVSRLVAVPVFLLGLYAVLSIAGLTGLAVTVIGGTGLVGLIIGFAFRDIAENFLASILISMQRPFATNDLIQVAGYTGFVQSVNPRSTLLMTVEGNHVQIPNATIYKETIVNFTANPIARFDFAVGIGYDDAITAAQSVALDVLRQHPAVLRDPEPLVLVEALGAATVNLRIYFWIDVTRYSQWKVKSAVIRLTKRAFVAAGISMPDEAREVVFPRAVPVQMVAPEHAAPQREAPAGNANAAVAGEDRPTSSAEGNLASEAGDIERQAKDTRPPEGGPNLLES